MNMHVFINTTFQRHLDNEKLAGSRCRSCGSIHLPPRPFCSDCYSDDLVWDELDGRGELVAFTAVHIAPTAMLAAGYSMQNPYVSGIVKLRGGPSISAQIVGVDATQPQDIRIGSPVQVTFIEREGSEHKALAFAVIND
jgi:uncharacterized OB-fold protein